MTACAYHPRQLAAWGCAACAKPICSLCSFEIPGRGNYCSDCAVSQAKSQPAPPPPPRVAPPPTYVAPPVARPEYATVFNEPPAFRGYRPAFQPSVVPARTARAGQKCVQHRDVEAEHACYICYSGICNTCDFLLPTGVHVCPECIEKQGDGGEMSDGRKTHMRISFAMAAAGTLLTLFLLTGALQKFLGASGENEVAYSIIGYIVLMPGVVGLAFSVGSMDRRLVNSTGLKVAAVWNSILMGMYIILTIIGASR